MKLYHATSLETYKDHILAEGLRTSRDEIWFTDSPAAAVIYANTLRNMKTDRVILEVDVRDVFEHCARLTRYGQEYSIKSKTYEAAGIKDSPILPDRECYISPDKINVKMVIPAV